MIKVEPLTKVSFWAMHHTDLVLPDPPPPDAGGGVTMRHTLELRPRPRPHTDLGLPRHHAGRN